jgi:branched-chain amino acid transport system substrate-binding protein
MRKPFSLLLTLGLAAALSGCAGEGTGGSNESGPIKIGLIASLTGNFTPLGTDNRKGVELAVKEINDSGGINGRQIELLVRDEKSAPDQGIIAYNDLKGQGVAAIIGPSNSNSNLAIAPLAERDKLPFIACGAADAQVIPVRPYVFQTPPTSDAVADNLLAYLSAQNLKSIALAHDSKSSYAQTGKAALERYAPKYGVRIVRAEPFETGATDFSPVFTKVRGLGAQALVFWATGAPAVVFAKQYATADLGMPLLMTPAQASKLWLEPVGSAAEGIYVSSLAGVVGPVLPDSRFKQTVTAMAEPFRQQHGYHPPQFAFDGYSALTMLARAIESAGGTDGEQVRKTIESTAWLTPSGSYEFTPDDHRGLTSDQLSVNVVRDGAFTPTEWSLRQLATTFAE